jgi:hypothetical protein
MDPTFNETMMQTMHPDTFESTNTQSNNAAVPGGMANQSATSAQGIDEDGTSSDGYVQIQEPTESYNDTAFDQQVSQGTTSLPQDPASEQDGVDHASLDLPSTNPEANTHTGSKPHSTPGLDLDAILAGLEMQAQANASKPPPVDSATPTTSTSPRITKPESSALPPNPNLPPKPPAQDLTSQSNYTPTDDIRSYHPHSQKDPPAPYRGGSLSSLNTNGLPQPPHSYQTPLSSTFVSSTQSPAASNYGQGDGTPTTEDEDIPLDPQTQRLYDQFLSFERQNVADGQWDKFPVGSRLFIGMLVA